MRSRHCYSVMCTFIDLPSVLVMLPFYQSKQKANSCWPSVSCPGLFAVAVGYIVLMTLCHGHAGRASIIIPASQPTFCS